MLIHIQHGKGGRDRYVPLSATLLDDTARVLALDETHRLAVSRHDRRLAGRHTDHAQSRLGRLSGGGRTARSSRSEFLRTCCAIRTRPIS